MTKFESTLKAGVRYSTRKDQLTLPRRLTISIVGLVAIVTSLIILPVRAPADDTAIPSAEDKRQIIQEYYNAVSSRRYDQAYRLVAAGFYASASDLKHTYREIGTANVDVADIPNSVKAHVKVTLHWVGGETTTIYVGTITLAYNVAAGGWLIAHRSLELVHGPPIDAPENSLTLPAAISAGIVGYALRGLGNSGLMEIRIRNKTDRVWELTIEEGLRLEPNDSSVQTMTVTKENRLKLEPHEETTQELEVACLDISKPPPSKQDTSWTIAENTTLSNYVSCTNDIIDVASKRDPSIDSGGLRPALLQFSLWAARGASESDWASFYHEWHGLTLDAAMHLAREFAPQLQVFTRECGLLT